MADKVYCGECEFFKDYDDEWESICFTNPIEKNNHIGKYEEYQNPADKNEFNDCKDFKLKVKKPNIFQRMFKK